MAALSEGSKSGSLTAARTDVLGHVAKRIESLLSQSYVSHLSFTLAHAGEPARPRGLAFKTAGIAEKTDIIRAAGYWWLTDGR